MTSGMSYKGLAEQTRVNLLGAKREWALRGLQKKPLHKAALLQLERAKCATTSVCHLIGSGWSLADSMENIAPDDYIVGYNLAALSGMKFDAYYTERTNERRPGINKFYKTMLDRAEIESPYLKNIHERNASLNAINFHLSYGAIPFRTFNAGGYFVKGEEDALCRYLLDGGGTYFLQYRSTLMLLIVIYANLGFRNIVLHGHDLSGPYFFDVQEFALAKELDPRGSGILPAEVPEISDRHIIDQSFKREPQLIDALPQLVRVLAERGIALSVASARSPLARVVPQFVPIEV